MRSAPETGARNEQVRGGVASQEGGAISRRNGGVNAVAQRSYCSNACILLQCCVGLSSSIKAMGIWSYEESCTYHN